MPLTVLATLHAKLCGLRVIVRVSNAGAELNEQHGRTNRNNRPHSFTSRFQRNRSVIGAVISGFCETSGSYLKSCLSETIKQDLGAFFQPYRVAFDLSKQRVDTTLRKRNLDSLHDTLTLLTA